MTKLYGTSFTILLKVEADGMKDARRTIAELREEIMLNLPAGAATDADYDEMMARVEQL